MRIFLFAFAIVAWWVAFALSIFVFHSPGAFILGNVALALVGITVAICVRGGNDA